MLRELDFLRELNILSVMLRLTLAMVFGGLIGMERGRKGRAAGFRTYMVVCLGATLTMILGQYELHMLETRWVQSAAIAGAKTDITRFAAQVINGVGFLGAGTILFSERKVTGLTTAAGLWSAAGVGLALGIGFYEAALIGGVAIFTVMTLLQKMDNRMHRKSKTVEVYMEVTADLTLGELLRTIRESEYEVQDVQRESSLETESNSNRAYIAVLKSKKRCHHIEIVESVRQIPGIVYVEEL